MTAVNRAIYLCLALLGLCGLVFAMWPEIDLAAAQIFFGGDHFFGRGWLSHALRLIGIWIPIAVLLGAFIIWIWGLVGKAPLRLSNKIFVFLLATMILGPGLIVNVGLKDHSHRPRPFTIHQFGGSMEFRPWYRFDGACDHNCSFISGESASATWLVAPALLAPPPFQPLALVSAGLFTAAVSLLRMAFGAHFLSDVLFSTLLNLLLILLGFKWLNHHPKPEPRHHSQDLDN